MGRFWCNSGVLRHANLIYRITSPSGRVYIGQTNCLSIRFGSYKNPSKCLDQPMIHNSLVKYGWDAHVKDIVDSNLTPEEANDREVEWIAFYKAKGISMNVADGGQLGTTLKGGAAAPARPIRQYDTEGQFVKEWDCLVTAARSFGVESSSGIRRSAQTGGKHLAYGFQWRYPDDPSPVTSFANHKNAATRRSIVQLNLDSTFVTEHPSILAASESIGAPKANLTKAIKMRNYAVKGFLWCTKEDYATGRLPTYRKGWQDRSHRVRATALIDGGVVEFRSKKHAARHFSISEATVTKYASNRSSYQLEDGTRWSFDLISHT